MVKFALMAIQIATGESYAIDYDLSKDDCLRWKAIHETMTHVELEPNYRVRIELVNLTCLVIMPD